MVSVKYLFRHQNKSNTSKAKALVFCYFAAMAKQYIVSEAEEDYSEEEPMTLAPRGKTTGRKPRVDNLESDEEDVSEVKKKAKPGSSRVGARKPIDSFESEGEETVQKPRKRGKVGPTRVNGRKGAEAVESDEEEPVVKKKPTVAKNGGRKGAPSTKKKNSNDESDEEMEVSAPSRSIGRNRVSLGKQTPDETDEDQDGQKKSPTKRPSVSDEKNDNRKKQKVDSKVVKLNFAEESDETTGFVADLGSKWNVRYNNYGNQAWFCLRQFDNDDKPMKGATLPIKFINPTVKALVALQKHLGLK